MFSESGTRFWKRTTLLRQTSFLVDRPLSEKGRKMLIGLWPEDDVNHLRLVYTARYAERKPGLDKSQGC